MDKLGFGDAVRLADELIERRDVRLELAKISVALRASRGPSAFFREQANRALEKHSIEEITAEDVKVPEADKWLDRNDTYHKTICRDLDRIIVGRLESESLPFSRADVVALRIMLTSRFFNRCKKEVDKKCP